MALRLERDRAAREDLAVLLHRGIVAGHRAAADLRLLVAQHGLAVHAVDDLAAAVDLDLRAHPLVAVERLGRRVDAVPRVELAVEDHVRPRRAEVGRRAGAAVAAAAQELRLDADGKVLFLLHRRQRLPVEHHAAVAEGPGRPALRLFAHEAVFDRDHVVREGRLVEEVAEPRAEGVVLVVGDLDDAVLDAEGVPVVVADLVPGELGVHPSRLLPSKREIHSFLSASATGGSAADRRAGAERRRHSAVVFMGIGS